MGKAQTVLEIVLLLQGTPIDDFARRNFTVEGDKVMIRLSGSCVGCQAASVTIEGVQQRLTEKLGRPLRVVPVPAGL